MQWIVVISWIFCHTYKEFQKESLANIFVDSTFLEFLSRGKNIVSIQKHLTFWKPKLLYGR